MERTLKIFLSCALGAGIGALTALQLNQYFWWIGMLVGGFIGYLSYEIKQVLAAIPLAWQKASRWRPDKKMWKLRARAIARILSLSITAGIGVSLLCWFVYLIIVLTPLPPTTSLEQVLKTSVRAFLLCFPIFFCFFSFILCDNETVENFVKSKNFTVKKTNPLKIYLYYPFKGITWFLQNLPEIAVILVSFFKNLLLIIHSDIRLMCGVDAAIGAGIGYFVGNAIIGAIAGGVFGVINYKLISQKVLKLHLKTNH